MDSLAADASRASLKAPELREEAGRLRTHGFGWYICGGHRLRVPMNVLRSGCPNWQNAAAVIHGTLQHTSARCMRAEFSNEPYTHSPKTHDQAPPRYTPKRYVTGCAKVSNDFVSMCKASSSKLKLT